MAWQIFAAMALNAYGQKKQGEADARSYARQAALDEFEAEGIIEESEAQADQVFMQALAIKSKQVSQLANSGAVIGDGSAQAVVDETEKLARMDAMAALYQGSQQASVVKAGGDAKMVAGREALLSSKYRAVTGAASQYLNYKASRK